MDFLAAYEEKLWVNSAPFSQEQNILARINETLLYNQSYGKVESGNYLGTFIYQNGYLNQSLLSSNGAFYGTDEFRLLVNISTYQEDEAGEYFVIVYSNIFALNNIEFCPPYLEFLIFYLPISEIIWHLKALQIQTAGK